MKKFITVAAMAMAFLCVEYGNAGASALNSVEFRLEQGEMDPVLAMSILQAASLQADIDLDVLWEGYQNGVISITAVPGGWRVSEGGAGIIIAEDNA